MKKLLMNNKRNLLPLTALLLFVIAAITNIVRIQLIVHRYPKQYVAILLWIVPFILFNIGFLYKPNHKINKIIAIGLLYPTLIWILYILFDLYAMPSFIYVLLDHKAVMVGYLCLQIWNFVALLCKDKLLMAITLALNIVGYIGLGIFNLALGSNVYMELTCYVIAYSLLFGSLYVFRDKFDFDDESTIEIEDEFYSDDDIIEDNFCSILEVYAYSQLGETFEQAERALKYIVFYDSVKNNDFKTMLDKKIYGKEFINQFATDISKFAKEFVADSKSQKFKDIVDKLEQLAANNDTDDRYGKDIIDLAMIVYLDSKTQTKPKADILSTAPYPLCELSNFAVHPFELDGIKINSMEGFLQALKFSSPLKQKTICLMTGKDAKKAGKRSFRWHLFHRIYWNGQIIDRVSSEYTNLLNRAYNAMADANSNFVKILLEYQHYWLQHSIGKNNPYETVLTRKEFINQLIRLQKIYAERNNNQ